MTDIELGADHNETEAPQTLAPVIALIGRPNVGKSTLFNRLTKSRRALVHDEPGVTRDRQYGAGKHKGQSFIVIDTGGIGETNSEVTAKMADQVQAALEEADAVFFLVDGKAGCTADDLTIAKRVRALGKPITLVVNKSENLDQATASSDFFQMGLGDPIAISASHGRGVKSLIQHFFDGLEVEEGAEGKPVVPEHMTHKGIRLAIVGRPNVGKSTLVNRILGEERTVVSDLAGTTRDTVFIPMERHGQDYTLIDTAGVRRRKSVKDAVEKFSVIKTLQAIEHADVVLMVVDAQQSLVEQDLHLLGFITDEGKALVIAVNKWDGLSQGQKDTIKSDIDRRFEFVSYAKLHFISALHGTGVGDLFGSIQKAYESAHKSFTSSRLTRILEDATQSHPPPLVKGRRIKLRYAHQGGKNPQRIVIHGNQTERTPLSYQKYLSNLYRKVLRLVGAPVFIDLRTGDNPYEGRRDNLTPRQRYKKTHEEKILQRERARSKARGKSGVKKT